MMMMILWTLLSYSAFFLSEVTSDPDVIQENDNDGRRPIWNVAHMVNALYQVDYYLDMGANSLEFDVAFDWEGNPKFTFHGIPCDCFRSCLRYEHFDKYMEYMRELTTPGHPKFRKGLVLLMMDMKIHGLSAAAKAHAGHSVADKLLKLYWENGTSGARAQILVSLPSIIHIDFIRTFRRRLQMENSTDYNAKIGYDFSGNENLDSIFFATESMEITSRLWQGDGITNCLPRGTSRLREALSRRDQLGAKFIDKVYWWTVDKMSTMRTTLRMGVDAMITNYPDRLVAVLAEEEFSKNFRLATHDDSPWKKHALRTANLVSDTLQARGGNIGSDIILNYEEDELLYNC